MSKKKNLWALGLMLSQMGICFVVILILGVWLDKQWETRPIFSALGLLVGASVSVLLLIRVIQIMKK